ncbi:MAG: S41 family peptidase [Bacteroidales bacterium]|nr:S41 family peptidase [Bacteroidales bacterium]
MNSRNNKFIVWMPVVMALCIVAGIFLGSYLLRSDLRSNFLKFRGGNKIDNVLDIIETNYVDTLKMSDLVEKAIPSIFKELDPHSVYIPAADLQMVNEELEGSFSGIGIQFNMISDTITVVGVISGGPSEKVGILPGDRIVMIEDSLFVGKTTEKVMQSLRGEKGSKVKVGVQRGSSPKLIDFEITRGDVPVNSVEAAFPIDENIGYIKVGKFGRTTYDEFITAIAKLENQNVDGLIVDLRGNSGGYMDAAINMINEFLPKGRLIVYTEGKNFPRSDAFANGTGIAQNIPLVVLMDEWSASASEIFAGAIQDNDRGSIVGRRSFGKGLVQNQIPLSDGSAVRLTIARYFTPSGRSIQKQYELGKSDDYEQDILNRYAHGEFDNKDSIKLDHSETYQTFGGREVYGGGGIMPDYFIPRDTSGMNSYYSSLANKGIIYEFTFQYTDKNRAKLKEFKTVKNLINYLNTQPMLEEIADFAFTKGIKKRPRLLEESKDLLLNQINALIARNMLGENAFYEIYNQKDPSVNQAIKLIKEGKSIPALPASATKK